MYFKIAALAASAALVVSAQSLIVTAEAHHGAPPTVTRDDVSVELNHKPASVRSWIPLRGAQGALQLYVAIDDGSSTDLGLQFSALKNFVNSQPEGTRVGLAYLKNGSADIAMPVSAGPEQFAKALRLPMGVAGISASPYMGISDLIKKWPAADARREILLISSGIDTYYTSPDPQNPYLQEAVASAQRAGIIVHAIYFGGAGHLGHSIWRINWGQNDLSQLTDETGGELYWQGFGSPVALDPYLKDLEQRLENQYLLTVEASGGKGGLEPVRVTTAKHDLSLLSASRIRL
jgi:hypothetical protein